MVAVAIFSIDPILRRHLRWIDERIGPPEHRFLRARGRRQRQPPDLYERRGGAVQHARAAPIPDESELLADVYISYR